MFIGEQLDEVGWVEAADDEENHGNVIEFIWYDDEAITTYYDLFMFCKDSCDGVVGCNSVTVYKDYGCFLRSGCLNATVSIAASSDTEITTLVRTTCNDTEPNFGEFFREVFL